MAAISAHELELPGYDPEGLDREQRLARLLECQREHWLARTPLGYGVMGYSDIVAILRERRGNRV